MDIMLLPGIIQKPIWQGIFFILATVLIILLVKPKLADKVWVICGLVYGVFILINSILLIWSADTWTYFFVSLGVSCLYLLLIAIVVNILIKLLSAEGNEESAMIFLVIVFHPLTLLAGVLVKWLFMST